MAASPIVSREPKPFASVLIANRGEIAVRLIFACQELGIRAIAVYSDADRDAPHVRLADAAYRIGPPPARESYLNIPAIIAAAQASGTEAIHPGYGFLSENAEFADACAEASIVFIGPPPSAIRAMGSKTAAKRAAESVGTPTVPGYMGTARDLRTLQREAARIGYPVLLKATAGGGGMGQRAVERPEDFAEALASVQREALASFGDSAVFFEKLIVAPRHVEFQILGDMHGHMIHLGERECSIQRRRQKVIEESPCVALTPELRAEMGAAAVRAAQAVGYYNAGTCEFLLAEDGSYYFLEMNTRLQVEHPITEQVTGVDLVHLQLAIAAGRPLELTQEQISPRGHAIEARLYAEDPAQGYLPSSGRILVFAPPLAPGVRVDAGVSAGGEVSMNYDPMLAKLIVSAEDRSAAIDRLRWALDHFAVLGVTTNIPLLRAITDEPDFQAGQTNTAFLETHDLARGKASTQMDTETALVAAALWETLAQSTTSAATNGSTGASRRGPFNPWARGAAAMGAGGERRFIYTDATGHRRVVTLRAQPGTGAYHAWVDDAPYRFGEATSSDEGEPTALSALIERLPGPGDALTLCAEDGSRETLYLARRDYEILVWRRGAVTMLAKPRPLDVETATQGGEAQTGAQTLRAPMAGTIIKVNAQAGDVVAERQTVVVLGAMKMEHAIVAPHAARVRRVAHAAGDVVPGGEALVELEPLDG